MSFDPGLTYRVKNLKSQTLLDVNGSANNAVQGHDYNGGYGNQRWRLRALKSGLWQVISVSNNWYLAPSKEAAAGVPLVGSVSAYDWSINPVAGADAFKLSVPGQDLVVELSNSGSSAAGTPVILNPAVAASLYQYWTFVPSGRIDEINPTGGQ